MRLRDAGIADGATLGAILSEFVDQTDWMPRVHTRAEDLAHADALIARGWVTVAEVDGRVSGFAACDGASLNALYVAAGARGQGIGTALLRHLQARQPRLRLWTFEANAGAQRFYARHGFAEVTRTDGAGNDEGLPDVQLAWDREDA